MYVSMYVSMNVPRGHMTLKQRRNLVESTSHRRTHGLQTGTSLRCSKLTIDIVQMSSARWFCKHVCI